MACKAQIDSQLSFVMVRKYCMQKPSFGIVVGEGLEQQASCKNATINAFPLCLGRRRKRAVRPIQSASPLRVTEI